MRKQKLLWQQFTPHSMESLWFFADIRAKHQSHPQSENGYMITCHYLKPLEVLRLRRENNTLKSLYVLAKGTVMLIISNKASTISILNVYSALGLAKSFVLLSLLICLLNPYKRTLFMKAGLIMKLLCVIKLERLPVFKNHTN